MSGSFEANSTYAPVPDTKRGVAFKVKADPKGENICYPHGSNVVVRNIANPKECYSFTGHVKATTVAAFSPSGFYCASGDITGAVKIWDTTQPEHNVKWEYPCLGGAIRDIAWDPESKRMCVVGEGNGKYGHVFFVETGSSCGKIEGHAKTANACSFKPTRPYRVVTCSEDKDSAFFPGPPFKMKHLNKQHDSFVNAIGYSPDGAHYMTGGADGKICLYEGKEGDFVKSIGGEKAHDGGIYDLSWSGDSSKVITASADKTVKMWDVAGDACLKTFTFGDDLIYQQVGCVWAGDTIISLQVNNVINYLDEANPDKPLRVIEGHSKHITALACDAENNTFYAGSYDGRLSRYDAATGDCILFKGTPENTVLNLQVSGDDLVVASGADTVSFAPKNGDSLGASTLEFDIVPKDSASEGDFTVIVNEKEICVARGGKIMWREAVDWEPQCVAVQAGAGAVAVGGNDKKTHVFTVEGDSLKEDKVLEQQEAVSHAAFSPDGSHLATVDLSRCVRIFDVGDGYNSVVPAGRWKKHTARVNALAWCPDSTHLATAGLDTNIIVWTLGNNFKRVMIQGAHPSANVSALAWMDGNTLYSGGDDACVRSWTITQFAGEKK